MKDKKLIIIVIVVSVLVVIGLFFLARSGKSVSWNPTFINTDTNPYGAYITYNLMQDIFNEKIKATRKPIYNNLKPELEEHFYYEDEDEYDEYSKYDSEFIPSTEDEDNADTKDADSTSVSLKSRITQEELLDIFNDIEITDTTAYVFINVRFQMDQVDLQYLLDYAGIGNNIFISAENFDRRLMDTLSIKTNNTYELADSIYTLKDYPEKDFSFRSIYGEVRFDTDSCVLPIKVLAANKKGEPVFIRLSYGRGYFYLHSLPSAFTNIYQLRNDKYDFAYRCLSYLSPNNHILWDEYQKQGLVGETSIFRVLLNNDALRISLYLTVLGFLLFMIFRAKRIQRIIPIIKPPVNSSIEFLDTISNLYYHKKDLDSIVDKRHAYFLDYIRKHYYLQTEHIDDEFIDSLSAKSGVEKDDLNDIFSLYKHMRGQFSPVITNESFLRYNRLLEDFYKKVKLVNKNVGN